MTQKKKERVFFTTIKIMNFSYPLHDIISQIINIFSFLPSISKQNYYSMIMQIFQEINFTSINFMGFNFHL